MSWTLVSQLLAAFLGAGGVTAIFKAVERWRKSNRVDVAAKLNDEALDFAQALKKDATEARVEAASARREAESAHTELRAVRFEVQQLTLYLRAVRAAAFRPDATVDSIRRLFNDIGSGSNGS